MFTPRLQLKCLSRLYSRMTQPLDPLPKIEKLSDRVIRVLGGNPSKFTLQGTNTYIVGQGPSRLLIDTGQGMPEWIESLESVLSNEKITITTALLTHWHPDHIGGVSDLSKQSASPKVYKHDPQEGWHNIENGDIFQTDGATLRAFHCPGHTTDHMAFILEEEDAMFTGDNVLGQGTAVFEDLATYMTSLDKMAIQFKGRAYPGHGPVINDGPAKIQEYIAHRRQREKQVLDVLAQEKESGWTSMEIVKVIYKDYPKNLWEPAEKGIIQILEKLQKEGSVTFDEEGGTWRLKGKSSL